MTLSTAEARVAGRDAGLDTAAAPIPADRSRSLRRWNRFLTVAHGAQFVAMLAISSTTAVFAPVVPTIRPIFENGQFTGVEPSSVTLLSIPLAWLIATFFLMSAIAHAAAGWFLRERYQAWLARGMNPLRWIEYAFSSTVMIVAIAYISYITEFPALIAIAAANVSMNLFGWVMETQNEGRLAAGRPIDWKPFIFGCIAGIAPWLGIFSILGAYSFQEGLPADANIPAFVYLIIGSLFVAFNIFAITMVLQYRKVGRWSDYLYGEKTYMVLSLVAKTLLAWQVWSGTLRP